MLRSLGPLGLFGLLLALAGIALIGYVDPFIAAGLLAILVGVALVVQNLLKGLLGGLGLGGAF